MLFKVIYVTIFLLPRSFNGEFTRNMENSDFKLKENLNKCVVEFLYVLCAAKFGGTNGVIQCSKDIVTNHDFRNEKFVKINIGEEHNQTFYRQANEKINIFDLRNSENFVLKYFGVDDYIIRRATFIFLQEKLDSNFFNNLHNFFVKPAYIIDENLKIFVFDPYKNGNASKSIFSPDFLGGCKNVKTYFKKLKSPQIVKKWPNTTLRIFYRHMPPYVNMENTGSEQSILRIITEFLQMKNESQIAKISHQAEKNYQGGNYQNELLNYLMSDAVDVILGGFHPTEDTIKDFDGTTFYYIDSMNLLTPKSSSKPIWQRVLEIYSTKTFIFIWFCSGMIIIVIFVHCFYNLSCFTIFWWLYQIMIESSIYKIHKIASFRVLLVSIMFFFLVHSTYLKTTLQMIYFSQSYEKEINTKDDAIASGLMLYTYSERNIVEVLKNRKCAKESIRAGVCTHVVQCLNRIAHKKDAVMIFLKKPTMFSIPKYYLNKKTNESLINIGEIYQMISIQMIFKKFCPPFEDINLVLSRVLEGGIASHEAEKQFFNRSWLLGKLSTLQSKVLNFRHLMFIFFVWGVGIFVASIVFLGELIRFYYL